MLLGGVLGLRAAVFVWSGSFPRVKLVVVKVAPEDPRFIPVQHVNTVDSDGAVQLLQKLSTGMTITLHFKLMQDNKKAQKIERIKTILKG